MRPGLWGRLDSTGDDEIQDEGMSSESMIHICPITPMSIRKHRDLLDASLCKH